MSVAHARRAGRGGPLLARWHTAAMSLAFALALGQSVAGAQVATPARVACAAPATIGTPEVTGDTEAASEVGPSGTPSPEAASAAATDALLQLVACLNTGDFLAAGRLMTSTFLESSLGVTAVEEIAASFEGVQEMRIVALGDVTIATDGALGIVVTYEGLFSAPGQITVERWYFREVEGVYRLDRIGGATLPAGVLPDATIVEVTMRDHAFTLSATTVPADRPVILRATNEASATSGHVAILTTLAEGVTADQLATGAAEEEAITAFLGAIYLEPGQTGDVVFTQLAPGIYTLICNVETAEGTPHYRLGMIAELRVE